jgi:NADH-quinone oxidoreductase subunit A
MNSPLLSYALIFTALGAFFILIHLLLGKLLRPNRPDAEKKTIYECGEPTVGSAWIQFDLRFYVVALLFVIFDVEVAFFFPWAEVFGKANDLAARDRPRDLASLKQYVDTRGPLLALDDPRHALFRRYSALSADEYDALRELCTPKQSHAASVFAALQVQDILLQSSAGERESMAATGSPITELEFSRAQQANRKLAWLALFEILLFFGILLVGFAYLWRRGDLQWVRSTLAEQPATLEPSLLIEPTPIGGDSGGAASEVAASSDHH